MTPLSPNRGLEKPTRYHPVLVGLHWFLAIFIVAALVLGIFALKTTPNSSPMKYEALRAHMTGGLAILLLMSIRLAIRSLSVHPAAADAGSDALNGLAKVSHFALYGAVFGMVAAGLTTAIQAGILPILAGSTSVPLPETFNVFPARVLHGWISKALMSLITLHVAAAFYHQFMRRDGLLSRMWFGRRWREYTKSRASKRLEPGKAEA
jgi:cytochrome b561